jgi:hypothetical protein
LRQTKALSILVSGLNRKESECKRVKKSAQSCFTSARKQFFNEFFLPLLKTTTLSSKVKNKKIKSLKFELSTVIVSSSTGK